MCLIAHVPAGKTLTREVFDNAHRINPDGIGVMSERGVEKFYGNKQLKRARNYVAGLVKEGVAHAVHWRYATHGSKGLALCHPFKLPNVDAWLMHNGVISSTAKDADDDASDTLLYVNKLIDAPDSNDLVYWNKIANDIGKYNKGIVMYPGKGFVMLNADEGKEIDGIWYSNVYSLPTSMRHDTSYFIPARMRPAGSWNGPQGDRYYSGPMGTQTGGYRQTNRSATDWGGPFGSMLYWSNEFQCYGFWEAGHFQKLKVEAGDVVERYPMGERTTSVTVIRDRVADMSPTLDNQCPRCLRHKSNPPMGFTICWCRDEDVKDYLERQQKKRTGITEDAVKATEKPALPSGPTLAAEAAPEPVASPTASNALGCEHGSDNWENCRECINELEQDNTTEVQRWLAERSGRAQWTLNESGKVIYLPRASEK